MKEYKIIYDRDDVDTEAKLNEFAAQGYVLRFVTPAVDMPRDNGNEVRFGQYVMEREKPEGQAVDGKDDGKDLALPLYGFWSVHLAWAVGRACTGWITALHNWLAVQS